MIWINALAAGAVIAGFLLTAVPNWTGQLPITGPPLAALFGLWAAGRLAMLCSAHLAEALAAAVDVSFYVIVAVLAAREVLAAKNRNLPIVLMVLLLGAANAVDHAAAAGMIADTGVAIRAAIALVVLMISLIGGRIVASFTRSWVVKQGYVERLPGQPSRYDLATIAATAVALLGWVVAAGPAVGGARARSGPGPGRIVGPVLGRYSAAAV